MPDQGHAPVSRDTRRLLATVLLSLGALWIFARLRFPERPPTPNPVAPVLTQIVPRAAFEDLERAVFDVEPVVSRGFIVLLADRSPQRGGGRQQGFASLRFRPDAALAITDGEAVESVPGVSLAARDRATGLAVFRTPASVLAALETWTPQQLDYPRYLLVSAVVQDRVSLRPAFVGPLVAASSAAWGSAVWRSPSGLDLPAGSFVFTTSGALAGLVSGSGADRVIVPAATVLSTAEQLLNSPQQPPGWLGVAVGALGRPLRKVTGVQSGVVVTWVDSNGPAAGKLVPTDIVQRIGVDPVADPSEWQVRVARLAAGEGLTLGIWRAGRTQEVHLAAAPPPAAPVSRELGLTMRTRRGVGVEILGVEIGSAAMRAGMRPGDILTRAGVIDAPTAAQVRRAYAAHDAGMLVALTRGTDHQVVALGGR